MPERNQPRCHSFPGFQNGGVENVILPKRRCVQKNWGFWLFLKWQRDCDYLSLGHVRM